MSGKQAQRVPPDRRHGTSSFQGWGGEDNDFLYRMDTNSAFDSHDDQLLHMYHPSSAVLLANGDIVNAHIPALTWPADAEIGDPARFAAQPSATPTPAPAPALS